MSPMTKLAYLELGFVFGLLFTVGLVVVMLT